MTSSSPNDISNPFFVRFYRRNRRSAVKRGENEHRRRALEGLSGVVVELGAGDGANFALYPPTVTEVVAVEPEPRFRKQAEEVARSAEVPVRVLPGTAEACRSRTRASTPCLPRWCCARSQTKPQHSPRRAA